LRQAFVPQDDEISKSKYDLHYNAAFSKKVVKNGVSAENPFNSKPPTGMAPRPPLSKKVTTHEQNVVATMAAINKHSSVF